MTGNYLIDYNKILDKRIAERSKNDEFYIKQYLINFNRLISSEYMNESDSVDSKVKQYLERYIEKYCGYGPDSLTMNTSFLYALQAMSNEPDSVKNSQLPSYLRYLLINKDNTKLLAQNISSRFYSLNRDNLPLLAVLSYFSVLNNNSFSVYEEAIKLAPEYEDYFYMLSMISQDEVLSEKDIITVKKYLDRVTKGITVPDELSNISSHSASEVINELAKKMFEFDKNNYFQEGAKFNDIYEISSFYNDMLATTFNNFAWRVYRNKDTKYIDDMIRLSRISLDLEPDNHYYLDTYAHLLYTKGNKEKAVEYEQRAYDLATAKGDLNSVESKMYKLRLHAMKTGTLEKYNTDEWNQ